MLALALTMMMQTAPATPPPAAPAPPPCSAAEYRAFDFWVGSWDVFAAGQPAQVATSEIESMFGGCAIRETWKPGTSPGGGSFTMFDRDRKQWRQAWVDNSGTRVDFDGGMAGDKMILTGWWPNVGGPGKHALIRMTYSREAEGVVRQHGEQSVDHGLSWTTSFDFHYRPRARSDGAKP